MAKILNEVKSQLKTLFCFLIACLLLPVLLLSFVCAHYTDELVNYILRLKYPTHTISKSKRIRTLIDTTRNSGLFLFLLHVEGPCDFEKIKQFYADHLTEVRDKWKHWRFPKLRQKLVTCWGHYAWVNDSSSFNIDNQVLLGSRTYRGRPINSGNIEEHVSELATKYIPSHLPQWQVVVIPTYTVGSSSTADSSPEFVMTDDYYLLVKVHHLILAEEEDLHVSELLMLRDYNGRQVLNIDEIQSPWKKKQASHFIRQPVHIQNLLHYARRAIINRWNEFIYEYDSLETPDGCRRLQITNLSQLLSVLLIVFVHTYQSYSSIIKTREKLKRRSRTHKDTEKRFITFLRLLLKEMDQRHLSWEVAQNAVFSTLHPVNLLKTWTKIAWQINVNHFLLFPVHFYHELLACKDLIFSGQTKLMNTYTGRLSIYLPMMILAQVEFLKICYEIYKAPVNIYEVLFEQPSRETNFLHMQSYSGRKIVSFSKSLDGKILRDRITFDDQILESDFVLSCLAGSLHDYFKLHEDLAKVPHMLNTTCRTITKSYFTDSSGDKWDHIGGVVFMKLPLIATNREQVLQMHTIVDQIRRKQIMIYLASLAQSRCELLTALMPRVLSQIFINFFATNFPVIITEIHGPDAEFYMTWSQRVKDVMLFRPPQSKTGLSLNIHRFGDKYRLAIMADTQLGPKHSQISRSFEKYMESATI